MNAECLLWKFTTQLDQKDTYQYFTGIRFELFYYSQVGREPSVSQTRITATVSVHRHTNGHVKQTEATPSTPSTPPPLLAIRSRPFSTKPHDDVTTVRVDMVSVIVFSVALGVRLWHISDPDSIV